MVSAVRTRDVFVAGGMPTVTYRSRAGLEDEVRSHLDYGGEVLSVSGPTKTGKTVLIRHVIPENAVMLEGGSLRTFDEFLASVLDHFDVPTGHEQSAENESEAGRERAGNVGSTQVAYYNHKHTDGTRDKQTYKQSSVRSPTTAAGEALLGGGAPLVVDDFHYIPSTAQLEIVRFLKGLVFDGLPVIFVSVPHRAYDAVRVEREMTGRVKVLNVGFWAAEELLAIPQDGFKALNLSDPDDGIASRLVQESFSSPHLMQQFCLNICKANQVPERAQSIMTLGGPPEGWDAFFHARASSSSKSAFDALARGPRQRTDRMTRKLQDGREVDIYGVVLEAIAATGPLISITWEELRAAIRQVIASEPPQRHEVTRVLDEMTKIAKERLEGEPVVDWDNEMSTLHISDPYFAYYLRWGTREAVELHRQNGAHA